MADFEMFYKNLFDRPPIKQRKPKAPEPEYPKCRALYPYSATEPDELAFNEGDIIYIVKEDGTDDFYS
jgi:hypothetical protein